MGQQYAEISDKLEKFITEQKIFFVGTATAESKVNISPKGMDSLRVLSKKRVVWLNVTGSGNETAAHVQENPRMTIMFAALEGNPMILRLYGTARVVHQNDPEWQQLFDLFDPIPGARQLFDITVELVQTSCGMAVPYYDFVEERDQLTTWVSKKSKMELHEYWHKKNETSLDGKPTHIIDKNVS